MFGIDCPERGQAYSQKARQLTSLLAFGREVKIVVHDRDAYGRTVADVILPDGRDLGLELVTAGLAWQYRRYSNDAKVQAAEDRARAAQRGLWADAHPVPPWEFRHADRKPRPTRKARPPRRTPAAA